MTASREDRIRLRAYEIWQREGERHGAHEEYWQRAEAEIDAEERAGAAKPAAKGGQPRKAAAEHAPGEKTVAASGRTAGAATRQNAPGNEPADPRQAEAATEKGAPNRRTKPRQGAAGSGRRA
jgi:Protein of unknown function (DUF2934)